MGSQSANTAVPHSRGHQGFRAAVVHSHSAGVDDMAEADAERRAFLATCDSCGNEDCPGSAGKVCNRDIDRICTKCYSGNCLGADGHACTESGLIYCGVCGSSECPHGRYPHMPCEHEQLRLCLKCGSDQCVVCPPEPYDDYADDWDGQDWSDVMDGVDSAEY